MKKENVFNRITELLDTKPSSEEKKANFIEKLKNDRDVIVAIMKLSDEKAQNFFNQQHPIIEDKKVKSTNLIPKKPFSFNIFKKLKNYFKDLLFKYLIEPHIKRIEKEKADAEKAEREAIQNQIIRNFYDGNLQDRKEFNEILARIRKESGGKSYGSVPMLFNPEDCYSHNQNPDRLMLPSLKDVIKEENQRVDRILKQQQNPNFIKNKVDLMMKKSIKLEE